MSTSFLRTSIVALTVAFSSSTLAFTAAGAGDRGFQTIAGGKKQFRSTKSDRRSIIRHRGSRDYSHGYRNYFEGVLLNLDLENDEPDLTSGFLREKVTYSPTRSRAKIIHVSDRMKRLGEERAARREARMLRNIKNIKFGYYRKNEAYDVRFPSIVYLDTPRR